MRKHILLIFIIALTLASCGSSKKLAGQTLSSSSQPSLQQTVPSASTEVLRKVQANNVDVKNIVADVDFTLGAEEKKITVGGKLRMRRDDVIRIQLVAFGLMEVGRLEFTKDYVMVVDKYHKLYVKEDYNKVSFLNENGLDFYALQALLWNQLYLPGSKQVEESDLPQFEVKPTAQDQYSNVLLTRGDFNYTWLANTVQAVLENINVNYNNKRDSETNVNCRYANFVKVGGKQFPSDIVLTMQSSAIKAAKTLSLGFKLSDIGTSDKWESRTELSSKYKEISFDEMLGTLMSLGK